MDDSHFDALTRSLAVPSRRRVLAAFAAAVCAIFGGSEDDDGLAKRRKRSHGTQPPRVSADGLTSEARRKKKKKKRRTQPPPSEPCGVATCTGDTFCCDDAKGLCCAAGAQCCNPGSGTGSCCTQPGVCAAVYGGNTGSYACCPPERQWTTGAGLTSCCPAGQVALGYVGPSGPCCAADKVCQTAGGPACCASWQACCNGACVLACGGTCCDAEHHCCGGACCAREQDCCNGVCCSAFEQCDNEGICRDECYFCGNLAVCCKGEDGHAYGCCAQGQTCVFGPPHRCSTP